jgi:hypothetical protein
MTNHEQAHQGMAPQDVYGHLAAYHQLRGLLTPWEVDRGTGLLEWASVYLERHAVSLDNLSRQEIESTALHMWDHEAGNSGTGPVSSDTQQRHGLLEILDLAGTQLRQLSAELRERDAQLLRSRQRAVQDATELGAAVAELDTLRLRQERVDRYAGPHSALEWGYGPIDGVIVPCTTEGQARDNAVDEGGDVWFRPANPSPWTLEPPQKDAGKP